MGEKNLVICDKELRYADSLGDNILARKEFALRVYICTCLESVLRLKKEKEIHIFIVDEFLTHSDREKVNAEHTFVLTQEKCLDLGEKESEVYKYQSSEKILAQVFEIYYEQTNHNILRNFKKQKKRILAVYSPIHRIGKTTFAIELGKELAKKEHTLYLNMEEYADVGGRFARSEGRNLGDLLYYMHQESGNLPLKISTMALQTDELDYIPPFLVSEDLKTVSSEEWKVFLEELLEKSIYETVILDVSDSVQGLWEILQCCDKIYMPILEDEISKQKVKLFEENIRKMQMGTLEQRIYTFVAEEDMAECARKMTQEVT